MILQVTDVRMQGAATWVRGSVGQGEAESHPYRFKAMMLGALPQHLSGGQVAKLWIFPVGSPVALYHFDRATKIGTSTEQVLQAVEHVAINLAAAVDAARPPIA